MLMSVEDLVLCLFFLDKQDRETGNNTYIKDKQDRETGNTTYTKKNKHKTRSSTDINMIKTRRRKYIQRKQT
jgi:hypothetical protein